MIKNLQNKRINFLAKIRAYQLLNVVFSIVLAGVAVIVGLRSENVGQDTESYLNLARTSSEYIYEYAERGFEPFFISIFVAIRYFSNAEKLPLLLFSILSFTLIFVSSNLIVAKKHQWVFIFFTLLFPFTFAATTNVIRQGIVLCGIFIVIKFVEDKKLIPIIILSFVMYFIHNSYPVFLISVFGAILLKSYSFPLWALSIATSGFVSQKTAMFDFLGSFIPRFSGYFASEVLTSYELGFKYQFVAISIFPIALIVLVKGWKTVLNNKNFLVHLYLVLNACGFILSFVPFFDRVLLYSWFLIPLVYIRLLENLQKSFKNVSVLFVTGAFLVFLMSLNLILGNNLWLIIGEL